MADTTEARTIIRQIYRAVAKTPDAGILALIEYYKKTPADLRDLRYRIGSQVVLREAARRGI